MIGKYTIINICCVIIMLVATISIVNHLDENTAHATTHNQKTIYYTIDTSIPTKFNIDYELANNAFSNAIKRWDALNPNLTFIEREYNSIKFNYVLYETDSNWTEDCRTSLDTCIIPIYLGKSDCTGMFIQADSNHIQNTVMHKIGHILGISHTNNNKHLMYSPDAMGTFSERGYYVPGQLREGYIGQDHTSQRIMALDNYQKKLDIITTLLNSRIDDLREEYLNTNNRDLIELINKYTSWNLIIEPKSDRIEYISDTLTIEYECKYVFNSN